MRRREFASSNPITQHIGQPGPDAARTSTPASSGKILAPSCVFHPQLKRERSLLAKFGLAVGICYDISKI
jgi:hypothetical protein